MSGTNLQAWRRGRRRAQRQGYVVAREVREELERASLSESFWKGRPRPGTPFPELPAGRYYYTRRSASASRRSNRNNATSWWRPHSRAAAPERRRARRTARTRSARLHPAGEGLTEDNREFTLLTRDLSATGCASSARGGCWGRRSTFSSRRERTRRFHGAHPVDVPCRR